MIELPRPDPAVLARRADILAGLRALVPDGPLGQGVIGDAVRLKAYETDGLSAYRQPPLAVVLPTSTEQVAAVLRFCHQNNVRVIPRGAGTSLSGGALPLEDGVVIGLMRMNRILEVDYADRLAVVEAGVTNIGITQAVAGDGFFYAPDPS
ncbi:FAD-binding oxidoreductase, partial [Teichococcus deserti]|uniref:FAD-binding oxidoreductase n=1 Tax=Teichococcus deserti TaxID=1817963 RepID=UPI001056AD32